MTKALKYKSISNWDKMIDELDIAYNQYFYDIDNICICQMMDMKKMPSYKKALDKLKAEKLKIERWRESREVTAQVKTIIYDRE